MTRRNMSLKYSPFLLKPAGKDYLWGGSRLSDEFSKDLEMEPLAESWECSTHPDGISKVANGDFEGMLLSEVLMNHPEFLGSRFANVTHNEGLMDGAIYRGELPILMKLIDAKKDLSVQVI